ncbi:MAG: hypothetical protein Q8876_07345 [Bacillota bacterium]|nr:hypothetical protein [Bacillota bacterium]
MSMTKNGIVYDLENSPYTHKINNVEFMFSSKLHRHKFKDRLVINRINFQEKFTKKYGIEIDTTLLADVLLYDSIETRGFLLKIIDRGENVWKKDLLSVGVAVMRKNLQE